MIELRDSLLANDSETVGDLIDVVDDAQAHVGTLQGETGSRLQRLELTRTTKSLMCS